MNLIQLNHYAHIDSDSFRYGFYLEYLDSDESYNEFYEGYTNILLENLSTLPCEI